jgi:hypothetical protein
MRNHSLSWPYSTVAGIPASSPLDFARECESCFKLKNGQEGLFHKKRSGGRVASPPGQHGGGGNGVGALDTEATRCPERACILHQIYKRGNEVFTLISCQVFPLRDAGNLL